MVTITNGIGGTSKIINWKGQVGFKFVKCNSICYVDHHKSYDERSGGCLLSGTQTQHHLVGAITGSIWPYWGCVKQNKTESFEGKKRLSISVIQILWNLLPKKEEDTVEFHTRVHSESAY